MFIDAYSLYLWIALTAFLIGTTFYWFNKSYKASVKINHLKHDITGLAYSVDYLKSSLRGKDKLIKVIKEDIFHSKEDGFHSKDDYRLSKTELELVKVIKKRAVDAWKMRKNMSKVYKVPDPPYDKSIDRHFKGTGKTIDDTFKPANKPSDAIRKLRQ